jgi:regulator of nonsense transcripts 2
MSSDPKQSAPPIISSKPTQVSSNQQQQQQQQQGPRPPPASKERSRQGPRGGRGAGNNSTTSNDKGSGGPKNKPTPKAEKQQSNKSNHQKKNKDESKEEETKKTVNKNHSKARNKPHNDAAKKSNDTNQDSDSKNVHEANKTKTQKQRRRRELKSTVSKGNAIHEKLKPTPEELEEIAKRKIEEERNAALLQAQKEQEERLAYLEKCRVELETDFRNRVSRIRLFVEKAMEHKDCRNRMSMQELSRTRIAFENEKKKLKSDLKKCTAFCKKIKSSQSFDDNFVASLLKDLDTLNLSRYLEEISNAFLDQTSSSNRKLKVGDVNGVVKVLIALHQRYKDFMIDLFVPQMIGCLKEKQDQVDPKEKRIYMRILTELLNNGVLVETKPIMKIVVEAAGVIKVVDGSDGQEEKYTVPDPGLLLAFAKSAGFELTGVMPKSIVQDVEFIIQQQQLQGEGEDGMISKELHGEIHGADGNLEMDHGEGQVKCNDTDCTLSQDKVKQDMIAVSPSLIMEGKEAIEQFKSIQNERAVNDEICNRFRKHLTGAMVYLSTSLISTHKKLFKMQTRCDQDRLLAGSLPEQREKSLKDAQSLYESIRKGVETLAEILNTEMPILETVDEEEKKDDPVLLGLEVYKGEDGQEMNLGPFDDEETRDFYCDIPDLLTTIPPALLGYSAEDVERIQKANADKYGSGLGNEENRSDDITIDECDPTVNESELENTLDEDGVAEAKIDEGR